MLFFIYFNFAMPFAAAFTRPFPVSKSPLAVCRTTWRRALRCSFTTRSASQYSHSTILSVPTAEDMEDVGGLLASLLMETGRPEGAILFLEGGLGAGKTALARGFVRGATGDWNMRVTSPTFLLSNTYRATRLGGDDVESDIEYVDGYIVEMLCVIFLFLHFSLILKLL